MEFAASFCEPCCAKQQRQQEVAMNISNEPLQVLVRKAARALARHGLINAYGHCSARIDRDTFLVCAAKPMGLIAAGESGTVVPVNGALPDGVLGEVRAHQQIYKRRPDVGGVCRFLSPKILSLSAMHAVPKPRHGFGTYSPEPAFWSDPALLRSDEKAAALAEHLGRGRAIVMRGNGAIVAGDTLEQAVVLAWKLEDSARVELDVLSAGGGATPLYSPAEVSARATFEGRVIERMWDYLTAGDPE
jgi:HCOMODA/2-hydroxy-3-carboxy-muconic semialdehyde decarboxylase